MTDITAFMATASPHHHSAQVWSAGPEVIAMKVRGMKYYFVEFYNENINHHSPGPGTVTSRYSLILKAGIFLC